MEWVVIIYKYTHKWFSLYRNTLWFKTDCKDSGPDN